MLSSKLKRVLKYSLFGGVAVGSVLTVAVKYSDVDRSSVAIVRLTRTAITAVDIGRTYRSMLYSKPWDIESQEYQELRSQAHQIGANKLLELCRNNRGVYTKVGQHIGALDYLLPNEYVTTLRILHKDAPKNAMEEVYKVIREDLKQEPKELFSSFDEEPLGTASLAQVHKATLKDGTEVAVKVQHPFVKGNISTDLAWMEMIVNTMSLIFPEFQMQWLVDETKKNIAKELNFLEEGKNAEKVAKLFSHYTWLKVPKIFWNYSTDRVLVMEYVHGGQVNDIDYIEKHNINKLDVCRKLGDLYAHMIFVTGFVHSDPHPGNILLQKQPDDDEVTVVLLDHGLYAQLTDRFRFHYSNLWLSIISRDREAMKLHTEALGIKSNLYILFACMVTGRPWESIQKGIDRTQVTTQEKRIFQNEIPNFMSLITQCLETVDRQALLVLKTNDLIRSIEYALGLQKRMCGFMVMMKCCNESVYKYNYAHAETKYKRQLFNLKYVWSIFVLYIYEIYLSILHAYA